MTVERYLDLERAAQDKHEFVDGEMVAMRGGSPRHALLTMNIGAHIHGALRGTECVAFSPDVRVCAAEGKLIAYPDATVVCGAPDFLDLKRDVIRNPTLLVEVLSPSTGNYDRGEKATLYRMMPSLREFLLVGQEPVFIEHNRRLADDTWQIIVYQSMSDEIRLESIACTLPVAAVYFNIDRY